MNGFDIDDAARNTLACSTSLLDKLPVRPGMFSESSPT